MPPSDPSPDPDSGPDPAFAIFTEPADFLPAAKPATTATHTLLSAPHETLTLRLVGHNPLWGHMLWHAARTTSAYLERHAAALVRGRAVLELGAGAGLPSIVCALRGAARVVVTDYPDPDLVANLGANIAACGVGGCVVAAGYVWGRDAAPLLDELRGECEGEGEGKEGRRRRRKFDVLVLSDLLFNHSQHRALAQSVQDMMAPTGTALVFFTPHRPWLYAQDMKFFEVASEAGFSVTKVLEERLDAPMFEEDPGDRELRRTVFGYELRWREE